MLNEKEYQEVINQRLSNEITHYRAVSLSPNSETKFVALNVEYPEWRLDFLDHLGDFVATEDGEGGTKYALKPHHLDSMAWFQFREGLFHFRFEVEKLQAHLDTAPISLDTFESLGLTLECHFKRDYDVLEYELSPHKFNMMDRLNERLVGLDSLEENPTNAKLNFANFFREDVEGVQGLLVGKFEMLFKTKRGINLNDEKLLRHGYLKIKGYEGISTYYRIKHYLVDANFWHLAEIEIFAMIPIRL